MTIRSIRKMSMLAFALMVIMLISCSFKKWFSGEWKVTNSATVEMPWAKFYWTGDSMGNKYFDRSSMMVQARIKGIATPVVFQFDLGANLTQLYSEGVKSVKQRYPSLNMKEPVISFGDFIATTSRCYIRDNYGWPLTLDGKDDDIGTIGADLFQGEVLIIDYPNTRFSIVDTVPAAYKTEMAAIAQDKYGRIILPMQLHGKFFKIMFDNGSSVFPLITDASSIARFSTAPAIDTLMINAWGEKKMVTSHGIKDTVEIAGIKFANINAWANYGDKPSTDYDAITSNALFWDKVVVIDFKNKKFGVK